MKIGDKVIFLMGREKGVIAKSYENGMVAVDLEAGMQVKVHKTEIAVDYSTDEMHRKPINTNKFYIEKTKSTKKVEKKKEVDLHLSDKMVLTLGKNELLEAQIKTVENQLNTAKLKGIKELVIIHGVGEGILKNALLTLLKQHKSVKSFEEADNRKYGKGATRIIISSG